MLDIKALAKKYEKERNKFENVAAKRSEYRDVHALLLLAEIIGKPGYKIISAAEHDIVYLEPSLEVIAHVATEDQFIELLRCGVHIDRDTDSLAMFV